MPDKVKVMVGGREVDATRVHVNQQTENFNTYLLEDGTTLKMKTVVIDVFKADEAHDKDGKPVYIVKSHNIIDTQLPGA